MRTTEMAAFDPADVPSRAAMSARLGREVRRRRSELGLSQAALARQSTLSLATLSAIERGQPRSYTAPVLASLDRALGWEIGHAQGILDEDAVDGDGDGGHDDVRATLEEFREVLADMRRAPTWQAWMVAETAALPEEDRDLLFAFLRRLRRR